MNYNHLYYFWSVAKLGKLTLAAEQLNVSQSALSTQIKKLEHQMGHDLFDRRGRRLILTAAGQMTLDYAETIFSAGEELLRRLKHSEQLNKQVIRIGAISTLSRNFQMQFIERLLKHDNIEVVIRSGSLAELLSGLKAHRLDVVLVNQIPLRDSATTWSSHVLDRQDVSLVGTQSRIRGRTSLSALLSTEPLILPTAESGCRNDIDILLQRLDIQPNIIAEVDDMAMMRLLARQDLGLAILPPIVVVDELSKGQLHEVCHLEGLTEVFAALTQNKNLPNPLLDNLLASYG
jgi:LysR family transcriptional activator of nhaA